MQPRRILKFLRGCAMKRFCLIANDCGEDGITGEWGSGFYAESENCVGFTIAEKPKIYSRNIIWENGEKQTVYNLERPSLLFDENGKPTHLFCASGTGDKSFAFKGTTYIVCIKLEEEQPDLKRTVTVVTVLDFIRCLDYISFFS